MESHSIPLKVRVILVTTRAALRHATDDRSQRDAIIARGRALLDNVGQQAGPAEPSLEWAMSELDALADSPAPAIGDPRVSLATDDPVPADRPERP